MKHLKIEVYGRVQGVSFRYYTQIQARQGGIKGFVQNQPDGSVYIEAEGAEAALNDFVVWCHQGPSYANVHKVSVQEGAWQGFATFEIRY